MRRGSRVEAWGWLVVLAMGAGTTAEAAGDWSLPDSRRGVRTAPLLLMTRPDVQADLGLTGDQVKSLHRAVTEIGGRAATIPGGSGAEVVAARRAVDEAQQAWIDKHLTADQQGRLLQIDLQWEGPGALVSRDWVGKWLSLAEAQKEAIAGALARNRTDGDARALLEELEATLSEEQRAGWQTLVGRVFEMGRQEIPVRPSGVGEEP